MKAVITGPRSGLDEDLNLPYMHIELDLEELPKRGDVIILNSGGSYYVKNIMWWVDGPENEAYWSMKGDYNVEGQYQVVHIDVEPDNRPDRYGYPAGLEEGKKRGGEVYLGELRNMLELARSAGGLDLIDAWVSRQEAAVAERKAAEAEQERRAGEILMAASKAARERRALRGSETANISEENKR